MAASQHCPTCGKVCHGGECYGCGWVSPSRLGKGKKPGRKTGGPVRPKKKSSPPVWFWVVVIVGIFIWISA